MKYIYTPAGFGEFQILEQKNDKSKQYVPMARFGKEQLADEYCRFKNAQIQIKARNLDKPIVD
jgi:hypothetical protein